LEKGEKRIEMKKIKPVGKWIVVQKHNFGAEKKTESGIIYKEKLTNPNIWSVVVSVGDKVTEDICVGDRVLWDLTKNNVRVQYESYELIHQDWIHATERQ
jgi:co-chaperonin GroES (HSP10)